MDDAYLPYSPRRRGILLEYLKDRERNHVDNHFYGFPYFYRIKSLGLIVPDSTLLRVGRSPAPDWIYFVNEKYLLESRGAAEMNMSAIPAEKGIFSAMKVLKGKHWSIHNLDIEKLFA